MATVWHNRGMRHGDSLPHPIVLERALQSLSVRIDAQSPKRLRPDTPDLGSVREIVHLLDRCLADLNELAGFEGDLATLVRHSSLQACFPSLRFLRHGEPEAALRFLLLTWARVAEALGLPCAMIDTPEELEASFPDLPVEQATEHEFLSVFNTAIFEVLRDSERNVRGRDILRRLMAQLDLSYDLLGRVLGTSGETVRRWERGSHEIPAERMADLVQADAGLRRLLEIFQPERLASGIRRKAGLFTGESALDWILRGRIAEAADRYEVALAYQG